MTKGGFSASRKSRRRSFLRSNDRLTGRIHDLLRGSDWLRDRRGSFCWFGR